MNVEFFEELEEGVPDQDRKRPRETDEDDSGSDDELITYVFHTYINTTLSNHGALLRSPKKQANITKPKRIRKSISKAAQLYEELKEQRETTSKFVDHVVKMDQQLLERMDREQQNSDRLTNMLGSFLQTIQAGFQMQMNPTQYFMAQGIDPALLNPNPHPN